MLVSNESESSTKKPTVATTSSSSILQTSSDVPSSAELSSSNKTQYFLPISNDAVAPSDSHLKPASTAQVSDFLRIRTLLEQSLPPLVYQPSKQSMDGVAPSLIGSLADGYNSNNSSTRNFGDSNLRSSVNFRNSVNISNNINSSFNNVNDSINFKF
jgi:hypothetical protein